jgi:hypothetical protein
VSRLNLLSFAIALLAGATFAIVAWTWVVFPAGRRGRALGLSALVFLIPILLIFFAHQLAGVQFPSLLVIVAEEALKLGGARLTHSSKEALSIVVLFGLWELAVVKTISILFAGAEGAYFTQHFPLIYVFLLLLPVAMHATTGVIYAYYAPRRIAAALTGGCLFHWLFNTISGLAVLYGPPAPRFSTWAIAAETLLTASAFFFLWRLRPGVGRDAQPLSSGSR